MRKVFVYVSVNNQPGVLKFCQYIFTIINNVFARYNQILFVSQITLEIPEDKVFETLIMWACMWLVPGWLGVQRNQIIDCLGKR